MKNSIHITLATLVVYLCGACGNRVESYPSSGKSNSTPIKEIEQNILSNDDPNLDTHDLLWKRLKEAVTHRLVLKVRNAVYHATQIYICPELTGEHKLQCRYIYADDTFHIVEFPESYVPIPYPIPFAGADEGIEVIASKGISVEMLNFYLGSRYHDTKKVPVLNNSRLALETNGKAPLRVLFSIVKGKEEIFYKKYIWVIGGNRP